MSQTKIHEIQYFIVLLVSAAASTQHDDPLAIQLDYIDRVVTHVMLEAIMERIVDLLDMKTFYRIDFSQPDHSTSGSGASSAVTSARYKPHDAQSRRIQTLVMFAVAMNHKEYREAEAALKRIAQKERERGKRVKMCIDQTLV